MIEQGEKDFQLQQPHDFAINRNGFCYHCVFTEEAAIHQKTKQQRDQLIINGAATSKMPRYNLIWKSALESLAKRLEVGEERKKEHAFNALRPDNLARAVSTNEFPLARLNNAIDHIYNAIHKIATGIDDGEDDAGAIMFAGAVLAEYNKQNKKK